MNSEEQYIEHEVKLRLNDERFKLQDKIFADINQTLRHMDTKMDSQFKWIIGLMMTMYGGLILTKFI